MEKKTFYITTTLPYVNASPHIGFASEIICADVRARYERLQGKEVIFNTGVDEHGAKIYEKAKEEHIDTQKYVDKYAKDFDNLKELLNLSYTNFIRTTDKNHIAAAQEIWRRVNENGFIYKKHYSIKYCIGCELEKTDSELDNGKCLLHPGGNIELIEEENYFFKFSAFQKKLQDLYNKNEQFVVPQKRFNEIKKFIDGGIKDFSISRVAKKMPWGIEVPGDSSQVMYVWFDALTNYISTLGWPENMENFEKFWGTVDTPQAIQIAGKDNLRQQSALWQAMLLATGLPSSRQVFINGFISVDGQKMSKSIGNVIAPSEMVDRYGKDATRYLLLAKSNFGEDSDISYEKMDAVYNSNLANGLGNLVSRVIILAGDKEIAHTSSYKSDYYTKVSNDIENMEFREALSKIWNIVSAANKYIEDTKPWELKKNNQKEFDSIMMRLLSDIATLSEALIPFMPETANKIKHILETRERVILFQRQE